MSYLRRITIWAQADSAFSEKIGLTNNGFSIAYICFKTMFLIFGIYILVFNLLGFIPYILWTFYLFSFCILNGFYLIFSLLSLT